ncbi:toxin-antitoxin system YwqK family antitoxin [Aquimarina aquimarini]|uniref:toxin-antitoxin system YwqK family antitoxin n=1 Tax=Aquimarina aquimarini TaxID=1191734 RepID=UPI00131EE8A3|nr:hypothetical protein [Aquimarina aquimarini]
MKIKQITTFFFLTFLIYHTTMISQNDTIFYNKKWKETTKDQADFYRPLPLQQKGENSLIKDYYIDGSLQFEGWSKTSDLDDSYVGKVVWFYSNGNKKSEVTYENGKRNGAEIIYYENGKIKKEQQIKNDQIENSKSYNKEGKLLNTIIYKDGYSFEGVSDCFIKYKDGKRIGKTLYYENTDIIAFTSECSEEGCYNWNKETYYDINGTIIQENKTINNGLENGREIEYYETGFCGYIKSIKSIKTYKNGNPNGPFIKYDLNQEILYQGIYKDAQPQEGTFEETHLSLTFISEYKNGIKNGKEIVVNKEKKIAEGVYLNGKRQTGTFVEKRNYGEPIIKNLIDGIEEGKQKYYNVARDVTVGYYHAKKGKKHGAYALFDYEGNSIATATYKNGKPYEGTVVTGGKSKFYKNGERLRENIHIDLVEKDKMQSFSKGSDKIEGIYNMGGFEMAGSIVFLDTHQFFYSLSVGSLDLITYGAYHLKNGKLKFKVPEEQKQAYVIYGRKDLNIKDSIQISYYNYNARSKPFIQLNKKWYSIGTLEEQQGRVRQRHGVDLFKIDIDKLSSMKIGIKKAFNKDSNIVLQSVMKMENVNDFNDFIIAYNVTNREISEFEKSTLTINGENIINGNKKKTITEEEKENVLDYIIENKSFPYYIRSNTFQKIKLHSEESNQKIHTYFPLTKK